MAAAQKPQSWGCTLIQELLWLRAGEQSLEPLSSQRVISALKPSPLMVSCKIHCMVIFSTFFFFSFLLAVAFHLCRDDAVSKAHFRSFKNGK